MENDYQEVYVEPLTERELEILNLLIEGLTNQEIGDRLFLAGSTVKWYVRQLNSKLNTNNRDEIVERAHALGLVSAGKTATPLRHNLPPQTMRFIGRATELRDLAAILENPAVRLVTILAPGGMGKTSLALETASRQLAYFPDGVFFIDLAPLGSFDDQLVASVQYFVSHLKMGYSVVQCIQGVAERSPEPVARHFRRVIADLQAGVEFADALERLREYTASNYFGQVIDIILTQFGSDGNLVERLDEWSRGLDDTLSDIPWSTKLDNAEKLIVNAIASVVDYQFHRDTRSNKQQLLDFLSNKRLLLLLDNFEHLLDGVPLVVDLLQSAPEIKILVTSREKLNLSGETAYTLQGMALPNWDNLDDVLATDAVKLLVQAAQQVRPDFAVTDDTVRDVAQVCMLTDGMPLGLLLAASWLDTLTLEEIAAEIQKNADILETEMHDVPERHRSIRAVFDSAWQRLEPDEQTVFIKLSIFRGGCTRDAAQTIAGGSARVLKKLVNKALLVQSVNGRYHLHALLRQYGMEKLAQIPGGEDIGDQHCDYYAALARHWGRALETGQQIEGLEALEQEIENIRAAWYWAVRHDKASAVRELIDMWYFFDIRSRWLEGIELFEMAVAGIDDALICARIRARESMFAFRLGMTERAVDLAQNSMAVLREAGEEEDVAIPLNTLGIITFIQGDWEQAEAFWKESAAIAEKHDDRCRLAIELGNLSIVEENRGYLDRAESYLQQQITLASEIGDYMSLSLAYLNLGEIAVQMDDLEMAEKHYRRSLETAQHVGQQFVIAGALGELGTVARMQHRYDEARQLIEQSLAIRRKSSERNFIIRNLSYLGELAADLDQIEQARRYYREALALVRDVQTVEAGLLMLNSVAEFLANQHEMARAVEILTFVHSHASTRQDKRTRAEELCDQLRSGLDPDVFEAAVRRGQEVDYETVLTTLLIEFE